MSILLVLRVAVSALWRNRLRTSLTMLGMAIGIGAVICTVALGEGSAARIHQQLLDIGDNLVWVENGNRNVAGVRTGAGGIMRLTPDDLQAIRDDVPEVVRCSPQADARNQLVAGNQNWSTQARGVSPDYLQIKKWSITAGVAFTEADVESRATVAILGTVTAAALFGDTDPVGQPFRIGTVPFTVVGVLGAKGQSATGQDQDDTLFIPYTTSSHYFKGNPYLDDIMCSTGSAAEIAPAQQHIAELLRLRHRIAPDAPDDFNLRSPDDAVKTREAATQTLELMLAAVAAVSLVVGGVGIMNIMLVSVAERTREIGLRMAIGAHARDVRRQFLSEAALLGIAGGLAGIVGGALSAQIITDRFGWPMHLSTTTIVVAVGFATLVGLVFGYVPASHAAQLDPIEALRSE